MASVRHRRKVPVRRGRRRGRGRGATNTSAPGKLEEALASLRAEVLILRMRVEGLEMAARRPGAGAPEVDPAVFARELRRVHAERATPLGTVAIPDLREALCDFLHITPAAFDRVLMKCWREGKVELEVGSPIGRAPGGHLEHEGKRYYYVRLPGS